MNAKPIIALSVLINVGLAAALVVVAKKAPSPGGVEPVATVQPAASPAPAAAPDKPVDASPAVQKVTQSLDWRMVESEDYRKYIANLRAIGYDKRISVEGNTTEVHLRWLALCVNAFSRDPYAFSDRFNHVSAAHWRWSGDVS